VTADLKELALVWAEAEKIARDCEKWRLSNVVMVLCPSQDDEDE